MQSTFASGRCLKAAIAAVVALLGIAAPSARAASYTGTVLYPLTLPSGIAYGGFSYDYPEPAAGGQVVGYGFGYGSEGVNDHALLWSGPPSSFVDLNPSWALHSEARGTNGTQQVGFASAEPGPTAGRIDHAVLWSGTADSAVDLNPTNLSGFDSSLAIATNGTQQVGLGSGSGATSGHSHALLWSSTADSAVDLNPNWITDSYACGTDGTHQVGYGLGSGTGNNVHALLWSGTAGSAVDLNPTGFSGSSAYGTNGAQQVGDGDGHAMLWSGTAKSAIDLHPTNLSGFDYSMAFGTNGTQQVGEAYADLSGFPAQAVLWSGTPGSAVELQLLLPTAGTWTDSYAYTIDAAGNVYGTAYGTLNGVTGQFAVEWSPLPALAITSVPPPGVTNVGGGAPGGGLFTTGGPGKYIPVPYHLSAPATTGYFQFGGVQQGDTGVVVLKFTNTATGLDPASNASVLADVEAFIAANDGTGITVTGVLPAVQDEFTTAFDVQLSFTAGANDPYLNFDFSSFTDSSVPLGDLAVTDIGLTAVPEPTSFSLVGLAGVGLLARSRHRASLHISAS
ncbi:MAG: hypothetical protein ABR964_14895 [Tepidisphaeraceae bacterium]|jgi:hypothetical protein